MKSYANLRELAWKRLWADHWFGRIFGGGLLLGICCYGVNAVISGILGRLGVRTWFDYLQILVQNRQDLTTPVPNLTPEFISQATSSTALTLFFSFITAGITSYGGAVILKKCLANEEKGWLGEAFGGFKCPFGMLWLQLRYWLIFFGWGIAGLFPLGLAAGAGFPLLKGSVGFSSPQGVAVAALALVLCLSVGIAVFCVPFYRYRFLFLVKAEHPDWSARECIGECRKLMKGNMLASFRLDCSYWKAITLTLLPLLAMSLALAASPILGGGEQALAVVGVAAFLGLVVFTPLAYIVQQYISVGQGFLYLELKDGQTTESGSLP